MALRPKPDIPDIRGFC